jgi:hypothetical protein
MALQPGASPYFGAYQSLGQQWAGMSALSMQTQPALIAGAHDVDPLRMGVHLFADRPAPADLAVPDVTYPLDFDVGSSQIRFHLLTWRYSQGHGTPACWRSIEMTTQASSDNLLQGGRLSFHARRDRLAFLRWWQRYSRRFYAGVEPCGVFLPALRPGRVNGSFVAHPTGLDSVCTGFDHATGLMQTLPAWAWIVRECRRPVFRLTGGWLFASAVEAAKFVLFAPTKLVDDGI